MNNLLLNTFQTLHQTPPFSQINESLFEGAFNEAIQKGKAEISIITNRNDNPTFENTIEALECSGKTLSIISNLFFNLNHANTNTTIQEIARKVSPLLTEYSNDIWLSAPLFEKVKQVYQTTDQNLLRHDQRKLLEDTYKAFVRKGALLTGDAKEEYRKITTELADLSLQFGENVLAETNDYTLHITNSDDLAGLPTSVIDAARKVAEDKNAEGWIFTLHFPSYMPFMKYAENRLLREQMFRAFASRGYKGNERDNQKIILRMTELRRQKALLLGFNTHADYVLEERMAESTQRVTHFLNQLLEAALPFAQDEMAEVTEFAKQLGFNEPLQRWDFTFFSEKLKSKKFNINDEMTRPYFQLEKVEKGIFDLAQRLYGLTFHENNDIDVYHPEVKVFEVKDETQKLIAVLYLDYFPRPSKQGGAWMTAFREQYIENGTDVRPLVSLVMNFTRPTSSQPSLLTHQEVTTFLHEFGHALHGMLSKVTYESQSGTNVYRDFVELPSQIMENWATEQKWLSEVAAQYQTGEVIPNEMVDKIIESANFQSGYATVRQISFGLVDMAWHTLEQPNTSGVKEFEIEAIKATELFPPVEGTSLCTSFSHIFDGGYAAGYYGYKWAEVLDADAFEEFKKNGIYDRTTAQRFRSEVLEKGGSAHPTELYVKFKGQEPSIEPLLKRNGLIRKDN
jgi:peptidyl-dipeptidase Dcp